MRHPKRFNSEALFLCYPSFYFALITMTSFVHLHTHSEFSLTDSILQVKDIAKFAAKYQMPAIALTDRNNLFGAVKFYKSALEAKIKPIIGCDLTVRDEDGSLFQLVILAKNRDGFRELCQLVSWIYTHDQDRHLALNFNRLTPETCANLLALSGGLEGDVARLLLQKQDNEAVQRIKHWQRVFHGDYYFQGVLHQKADEIFLIQKYHELGEALGVATVATNLACFKTPDDFEAHEIRVCISNKEVLSDPKRKRFFTPNHCLFSAEQMEQKFPQALLENAGLIAEKCNLQLVLKKNFLPDFPVPEGQTENDFLIEKSRAGLAVRLNQLFPDEALREAERQKYSDRLEMELSVITKMGFAGYFLIVMDFIAWAKAHDIPVGAGRGSGAGSLVAYALKITDLNPLPYDLFFERFLNPERVSMPDFDIDFCKDRRDEVINYMFEHYGHHRVAQIATHGTMAAKAVLKDVTRALGLPYVVGDQLAKMINPKPGTTLLSSLGILDGITDEKKRKDAEKVISPAFQKEYAENEEAKIVIDYALKLEGLSKSVGKHAGGVVVAPTNLLDFSALYTESSGGAVATQFDKDDIEAMGLVKFDFLGLRTLTVIDWSVKNIKRFRGEVVDINHIPLDDPAIYELLQKGQTTSVFQLESSGIKRVAQDLKPDRFEDIIALVALYRPGPMSSGMVDSYIKRKHGREEIIYPHEKLDQCLSTTYGVMIYQEQVMQAAQILAGYTLGGADELRRAMGKKKPEEMARHKSIFIEGAGKNGINEERAKQIFEMMEGFAEYGFNKSHSATYAYLTYQTAWLKVHYPAEFMAAELSSEMDKPDSIIIKINECRDMGLTVLPPSINQSVFQFEVCGQNEILYGLGAIKGLGEHAIQMILEEREKNGLFTSLTDFCARLNLKKLNKKTLETLVYSGAFDEFNLNRGGIFALIPQMLQLSELNDKNKNSQQNDMFGLFVQENTDNHETETLMIDDKNSWTKNDTLNYEKTVLGLFLSDHPIRQYQKELNQMCQGYQIYQIKEDFNEDTPHHKKELMTAGMIIDVRYSVTKKGVGLINLTLEDETGVQEFTLFKGSPEQKALVQVGNIVVIKFLAHFISYRQEWGFDIRHIQDFQSARSALAKGLILKLDHQEQKEYGVFLQNILVPAPNHEGLKIQLNINAQDIKLKGKLALKNRYLFNTHTIEALEKRFKPENIIFYY